MFQRDKELRAAGADRSRVVEKAKELREARVLQREQDRAAQKVQHFIKSHVHVRLARQSQRADFDSKVVDIDRLKALLQRETLPLPLDVLFELLRKLLFYYNASGGDQKRLDQLSRLWGDTLHAPSPALTDGLAADRLPAARRWQLKRLVDLCLQTSRISHSSATAALVLQLLDTCGVVRDHVATSRDLCVFSPRDWQYAHMQRLCLLDLTRQLLLPVAVCATSAQSGSRLEMAQFPSRLLMVAIHVVSSANALETSFVEKVLSIPLLPELAHADALCPLSDSPLYERLVDATLAQSTNVMNLPPSSTPGIPSITWLLGNLLSLSDRAALDLTANMLTQVKLFTQLLRHVPPETFAPSGVAVSWTKVSESHSVPVVFPDALSQQLRLLMKESRIRQICDALLLDFHPMALKKPLATERPTPMYPNAPTIHEQYGFGDIASSRSLQQSFSETWQRVKTMGRASWARRLLEKTGLKKSRDEAASSSSLPRKPSLRDTTGHARQLAMGSAVATSTDRKRPATSDKPYEVEHVYAVTQLFGTFLARWPHYAKHGHGYQAASMNVINVLSFYKLPVGVSIATQVHFVAFLWSVLQDVTDFEEFAKDVSLLHVKPTDGYACTLALFCVTYSHLLLVLDDEEMYEDEFPLPLRQLERIVVGLKHALHSAYWIHGLLPAEPGVSIEFGVFLVDAATRLLSDLYSRCSRLPFCNVSSWVVPGLDSAQLIEEVLIGTPRANKLISSMPFIVPFPERMKLFQRLVQADKLTHQGDASSGNALAAYRVRIRRNAILEDGLTKLNVIRSNLKKRINVVFVNAAGREEVGIDAGGLFKEFWLDLSNLAFDLQYGLFLTTTSEQLLYPNPHAASAHFTRESDPSTLFQFVGRILGKALYEGIVVQPKFAQFFLSKLLHSFNHLSDLPSLDPEIYKNLMFLKSYDGDVADLGLTFTVVHEFLGEQREVELIPNGATVDVTTATRTRYIHMVANYYLNTQIRDQSAAFRAGLADLIDLRWLQLFNEPELQVLISGKSGDIDLVDLKAHTTYAGGYYAMDKRVQWLWQALDSFSASERASFLRFTTSCQRAPSLGFGTLTPPFCIQKIPIRSDDELLPSSSTCFNTLKLPTYSSARTLRAKLLLSITSGAGFEMT